MKRGGAGGDDADSAGSGGVWGLIHSYYAAVARVHEFYCMLRWCMHAFGLLFNRFLWQDKRWRKSRNKRAILVIGDEHALGFGDWVICGQVPGYAKYLRQELREGKDVKFKWHVFNAGHLGARSDDWLPQGATRPRLLRFLLWKSLFDDNFGENALYSECDVVIIHLGANDEHADPERTAANVVSIARELCGRGKRVWVCGSPIRGHWGSDSVRRGWVLSERNAAVRRAVTSAGIDGLYLGVETEQYRRPELYGWDSKHLSRRGYQKMAKDLLELIRLPLIQIEWKVLQPLLAKKIEERDRVYSEKGEQAMQKVIAREMEKQEREKEEARKREGAARQ